MSFGGGSGFSFGTTNSNQQSSGFGGFGNSTNTTNTGKQSLISNVFLLLEISSTEIDSNSQDSVLRVILASEARQRLRILLEVVAALERALEVRRMNKMVGFRRKNNISA